MPKAKVLGAAFYNPQPVGVAAYKTKIKLGQGYRGPEDLKWTCQFTVNGSRKRLNCGSESVMSATVEAIRLYEAALAGNEAPKPGASMERMPAIPVFNDAAQIAIDRLTEAYTRAKAEAGGTKAHKFNATRAAIRAILMPAFETTPWGELLVKVREWNAGYRLVDGSMPSQSSIGNYNAALQYVNRVAIERGWLPNDPACIPKLSKRGFKEGVREPAFPPAHIAKMAAIMTDEWAARSNTHRIFRAWVALLATSGIRPGEEIQRIHQSHITMDKRGIFITIFPRQGKYKKPRIAVCSGAEFKMKPILADLFAWRAAEWKNNAPIDQSSIFANPKTGAIPELLKFFRRFLKEQNLLIDIETGQEYVPYSFRHAAITASIRAGHHYDTITKVFGTSTQMIERHYSHVSGIEAAQSMAAMEAALVMSSLHKITYTKDDFGREVSSVTQMTQQEVEESLADHPV